MKCRHCKTELTLPLVDLGSAPPSNAYLTKKMLQDPEKWYPLKVMICGNCWLVQTKDFTQANELFNDDYAYFSGFSDSWLDHSKQYVNNVSEKFHLNKHSHVVEIAANDGYLLQYVKEKGIPCTGIEPTKSTAHEARNKGIDIIEDFFGKILAEKLVTKNKQADLIIANNVLAHVPDINDFVSGFAILLKPDGIATFEFPHLLKLINEKQFDTIYHEHFSYLSFIAVDTIFEKNGLQIFDVEEINTHGGSLRIFSQRYDTGTRTKNDQVNRLREIETSSGVNTIKFYRGFQEKANQVKNELLNFLIKAKQSGKKVAAYGAAAKGNTLLNYAGVRPDLLEFVVDKNPNKQSKYMPGSKIPIKPEQYLKDNCPDYVLILPWNIKNEIVIQLDYIRQWGGKFVIAVPTIEVF